MKCPNCDFIEKDEVFGDPATCPKCGAIYEKALRVKLLKEQLAGQIESQANLESDLSGKTWNRHIESKKVIIEDIDMPFWSMVQFMVKWAIASIPAMLILILIFYGFASIFKIIFLS